jgi:hypothetical protein
MLFEVLAGCQRWEGLYWMSWMGVNGYRMMSLLFIHGCDVGRKHYRRPKRAVSDANDRGSFTCPTVS